MDFGMEIPCSKLYVDYSEGYIIASTIPCDLCLDSFVVSHTDYKEWLAIETNNA
jgi:hypothetical protein